ncbi:tetratricopeptide repeat protein [Curvibacter sp. APW13]|uniref:YfgM family protein n=1 Tax=Curvibacter sp. APW13 TaxID=3077236 RepID=UPI0028DDD001|nr:tetratricopeptide repeat protein [Curvibacter sp. APW13]MDT8991720.1 tetratricopeptide repeat protein [Curvibacter sp. APW13]
MSNHLDLEEQEQIEQLKAFWAQYGNAITALLVLVMLAFAAWNGYHYWQRQQSAQAAALYDEVERLAQGGDLATAQRAFEELTKRYPGTTYAQQSALTLAKVAIQGQKPDVAIAALRWASENGSDTALSTVARLRWAAVLMDGKDWDAALEVLRADAVDPELQVAVLDRRADAFVGKGDNAAAIENYKVSMSRASDKPDVQRMLRIKLNALGADAEPSVAASGKVASAK